MLLYIIADFYTMFVSYDVKKYDKHILRDLYLLTELYEN